MGELEVGDLIIVTKCNSGCTFCYKKVVRVVKKDTKICTVTGNTIADQLLWEYKDVLDCKKLVKDYKLK